jgi:hypothetical protein
MNNKTRTKKGSKALRNICQVNKNKNDNILKIETNLCVYDNALQTGTNLELKKGNIAEIIKGIQAQKAPLKIIRRPKINIINLK